LESTYEVVVADQEVGANGACIEVSCPNHSFLTKLVVVATSGGGVALTVDVFNSAAACDVGEGPQDSPLPATAPLYRVLPQQTGDAAGVSHFEPQGYPVFMHDNPPAPKDRKLYVLVNPTDAGTFSLSLGFRTNT